MQICGYVYGWLCFFWFCFAMNEYRLLQSESNLMILAMLDARLVAPHHVCYFISVQLRIIGKFLWHTY